MASLIGYLTDIRFLESSIQVEVSSKVSFCRITFFLIYDLYSPKDCYCVTKCANEYINNFVFVKLEVIELKFSKFVQILQQKGIET